MPKKVLGVYLAADRKIGDIIFLARRKGFEPRQTGLAPRRSRAKARRLCIRAPLFLTKSKRLL